MNLFQADFMSSRSALFVEHYDNSTNSGNYGTPVVTVTGGTFVSANGKAVGSYAHPTNNVTLIDNFVSGGTFSSDVNDLCAEGFVTEENADGTCGVFTAAAKSGTNEALIKEGFEFTENGDGTFGVAEQAKEELAAIGAWVKDMQFNIDGTDYYQVILLSGIDSLDYDEVGFEVTVDGVTQTFRTDKVFRRIKIVDKDGNAQPVYASNFGEGVNYIFGESFNFTLDFKDKSITFVPFAIREGETEPIYGRANVIEKIYE